MSTGTTGQAGDAMDRHFFRASADDFKKIPGSPITYWLSNTIISIFENGDLISNHCETRKGMATGLNATFVRTWHEVSVKDIGFSQSREGAKKSFVRWFPYANGGEYRKWYGNFADVVNWENDGYRLQTEEHESGRIRAVNLNLDFIFKPGLSWTSITSGAFSIRKLPKGFLFSSASNAMFCEDHTSLYAGLLNSKAHVILGKALNPTLNANPGDIGKIPLPSTELDVSRIVGSVTTLSERDWNSHENAWDFTNHPLIEMPSAELPTDDNTESQLTISCSSVATCYTRLRTHWRETTLEMRRLEEENNRIFIDAYGLQDELTPDVPLEEITLTCNPHYRYGGNKSEEELEALLLADTMREFCSYAVGCMFGRYSLDKPGLVLANQGETLDDYMRKIAAHREKVASGQWPVASKGVMDHDGEELQGSDCVAQSDGSGGDGVSGDARVSEGGVVRANQSDPARRGVGAIQHRGGAGAAVDSRVQELSVDSPRIAGGSGDATADRSTPGLSAARATGTRDGNPSGSQQNAPSPGDQTSHSPLTTDHLSFMPDDDNVIPMLDAEWFPDDVTERFRKFLRVTFGEEHYEENLAFIEHGLNIKGKRDYSIRDFFVKEFYAYHVKLYKKRPIYWLFASPKGTFQALIYLHRYRPDTVSVVLGYLRDLRTKLETRKGQLERRESDSDLGQGEATRLTKEIEQLGKQILELTDYERDVLHPLASQRLEIDLDDGVKANYPKFGAALKKIAGLEARDD